MRRVYRREVAPLAYTNPSVNLIALGGLVLVAAGVCALARCGLSAGGLSALEAARLGVYCHGRAGDAAAKEKGYYGITAGDLLTYLPDIIR